MDAILRLQSALLDINPGLIPLMSFAYSMLTSPHCTVMCSAMAPTKSKRELFYFSRSVGYTTVGAALGAFGAALHDLLEIKALGILAFLFFAILTLLVAGANLLPEKHRRKLHILKANHQNGFLRGFFFAAIPCHSLYFFYSLATLSSSPWGGALILFGHSVATIPALAMGQTLLKTLSQRFQCGARLLRIVIFTLCLFNLAYFGSRIFHTSEESKSKIFFCF